MSRDEILKKLFSRKFITSVAIFVNDIAVLILFGYSEAVLTEIVSVTASGLGYIFAETLVDKASVSSQTVQINGELTKEETKKLVQ